MEFYACMNYETQKSVNCLLDCFEWFIAYRDLGKNMNATHVGWGNNKIRRKGFMNGYHLCMSYILKKKQGQSFETYQ